jgi:hypothetical protein
MYYTQHSERFKYIVFPNNYYLREYYMPFNSEINSYCTTAQSSAKVEYLQRNLGNPIDMGGTLTLPLTKLISNQKKTEVVVELVNVDENDITGGSKVGKWFKKRGREIKHVTKKVEKNVKHGAYQLDRATRGVQKQIAKSATDKNGLIHTVISRTLDEVPQLLGEAAAMGAVATGNPELAGLAQEAVTKGASYGRNKLEDKTGYGAKGKDMVAIFKKYVPGYKEDIKATKSSGPKRAPKSQLAPRITSARNELVKKIMAEKGFSMPQASKYIKDNNLYQK